MEDLFYAALLVVMFFCQEYRVFKRDQKIKNLKNN